MCGTSSDTERTARRAGRMVHVELDDVQRPLLDNREAILKQSFHDMEFEPSVKGNVEGKLKHIRNIRYICVRAREYIARVHVI